MLTSKLHNHLSKVNLEHLGTVYKLIEQFELISRINLSKISGLAPASITNITKELIKYHFIEEKMVQNTIVRGRPATGLCISSEPWYYITMNLTEEHLELDLCHLDGAVIAQHRVILQVSDYKDLATFIYFHCKNFYMQHKEKVNKLLAASLCVVGRIDKEYTITALGSHPLNLKLKDTLEELFSTPVIITEHFPMWSFAEYHLGNVINSENVIFLQVDSVINISVLSKGNIIKNDKQNRMNIDKVIIPAFDDLADIAGEGADPRYKYCLSNQVTHHALFNMIDEKLPNPLNNDLNKIHYLCEQAELGNQNAIDIIYHVADCISYVLMNLVNLFSSEKVMVSSTLIGNKPIFLARLSEKLQENLLLDENEVEIVMAKYQSEDSIIASSAIKQQLYNGRLLGFVMNQEH